MSSPARNAVLGNRELLDLIFENLELWEVTELPRSWKISTGPGKQLLNLALTCKSFEDPALSRLWIHQNDLMPLIKMLPGLEVLTKSGVNSYYFHGTIPQNSRLLSYASRVRRFHYITIDSFFRPSITISPQAYVLLMAELRGKPLFPNLREFTSNLSGEIMESFFTDLPFIFSHSVKTAHFSGEGLTSPVFAKQCFPVISSHWSDSLRHLSIKDANRNIPSPVLDAIASMTNLETLDLQIPQSNGVDPETLVKLGKALTRLTSLTLDLHFPLHQPPRYSVERDDGESQPGLFPSLDDVHIYARCNDHVCRCTPPFLADKATSLEVILVADVESSDFLSPLVFAFSKSKLKSFEIQSTKWDPIYPILTIAPFLRRFPLEKFGFDLGSELASNTNGQGVGALFDAAFGSGHSIGHERKDAAPNTLRHLLMWNMSLWKESHLPFLASVAENAIGLERLSADVGLKTLRGLEVSDLLSEWRKAPPSRSTLRYLDVIYARTENIHGKTYADMAELLDLMFPQLISIRPYHGSEDSPDWRGTWWLIEYLRLGCKERRLSSIS